MDMNVIYFAAGTLVLANVGTIVTVFISALKLASLFGEMRVTIQSNTKDIHAAHGKIRDLEQKLT